MNLSRLYPRIWNFIDELRKQGIEASAYENHDEEQEHSVLTINIIVDWTKHCRECDKLVPYAGFHFSKDGDHS